MKHNLATALAVFFLVTSIPAAHAEFRVGIDAGYTQPSEPSLNTKEFGFGLGLFGQYDFGNGWGVHVGWTQPGGESVESISGRTNVQDLNIQLGALFDIVVLQDNGQPITNTAEGDINLSVGVEPDSGLDLLAVKTWERGKHTPFVMFGYSQVDVTATIALNGSGFAGDATDLNDATSISGDTSLSGWKLMGGVEGGDKYPWYVALEYATYGKEDITIGGITQTDTELKTLGLRFGVAYPF